jgi:hypothetical protein
MKRLSVMIVLFLAAGCRRTPPAAISVERRGADVVFHFAPCGAPPARIMDLTVTEAGAATATCSLVLTHDPKQTIAGQWRYGDVPAAYKKKRCDPLLPGKTYRLEVTRATLDFRIAPDGAVAAIAASCR